LSHFPHVFPTCPNLFSGDRKISTGHGLLSQWVPEVSLNELQHAECTLYDVNGNPLQLHGKLTCSLTLGSADYRLSCLICNISQDAILGQDFLLQYVSKIDYKKQILTTEFGNIPFGLLEYLVHNMTHKMQCAVLHVWLLVCL
jgi:hypothetical protein